MPTPLHLLTDTWPNDGQTYNAIRMDVTDNNNGPNNSLLRLRRGGTDRFVVDPDGFITSGLSKTFTTSQLIALGATTSKRLAIAYCTDCLNSGSSNAGAVGAFTRWSEASQRWMTFEDDVPVTTDFLEWAVWMHLRTRTPYISNPFASHFSIMPPSATAPPATTGGVAGFFSPSTIGTMDMLGFRQSLSSGAGIGSALARFSRLNQSSGSGAFSASMRRSMAVVATVSDFQTSVSNTDNIGYRFGLQAEETVATTWPNTFCGFVFDDSTVTTNGVWITPDASLRAVVRVNGTDIYSPTTIGVSASGLNQTVTANALCVATIEPINTTQARFRVGYQLADGSFTTAYDGVQSPGASIANLCPQAHFAVAKTAGTTARAMSFARASAAFVTTAGNLVIPYRPNFPTP